MTAWKLLLFGQGLGYRQPLSPASLPEGGVCKGHRSPGWLGVDWILPCTAHGPWSLLAFHQGGLLPELLSMPHALRLVSDEVIVTSCLLLKPYPNNQALPPS